MCTAPPQREKGAADPSRAFTLIELLVVVAIITALIAVLLPSLNSAREAAGRAACLSNLRSIGQATHAYADEDERHMLVPLHGSMVHVQPTWYKRTVMWFAWGGRAAPEPFLYYHSNGYWINETNGYGIYGTNQRPLTKYLFPRIAADERDVEVFHCPGDRGYPDYDQSVVDDAPQANAERSMYNTVGNSYRGSLSHVYAGGAATTRRFSVGVWGQRIDRLKNVSELIWGGDPMWFNMIGSDSESGWCPRARIRLAQRGDEGKPLVRRRLGPDHARRTTQRPSVDALRDGVNRGLECRSGAHLAHMDTHYARTGLQARLLSNRRGEVRAVRCWAVPGGGLGAAPSSRPIRIKRSAAMSRQRAESDKTHHSAPMANMHRTGD